VCQELTKFDHEAGSHEQNGSSGADQAAREQLLLTQQQLQSQLLEVVQQLQGRALVTWEEEKLARDIWDTLVRLGVVVLHWHHKLSYARCVFYVYAEHRARYANSPPPLQSDACLRDVLYLLHVCRTPQQVSALHCRAAPSASLAWPLGSLLSCPPGSIHHPHNQHQQQRQQQQVCQEQQQQAMRRAEQSKGLVMAPPLSHLAAALVSLGVTVLRHPVKCHRAAPQSVLLKIVTQAPGKRQSYLCQTSPGVD
jgi:hypothetical protein